MKIYRCRNQDELDKAVKEADKFDEIRLVGDGNFTAYDSANVTAYDSAKVTAYDSANVTAYDSANVTAHDSANVTAYDSAKVTAGKYVSVHKQSALAEIHGGVVIETPAIVNMDTWCDVYGVNIEDKKVVLYKAVGEDYRSPHGTDYTPGTTPEAMDWDGGKEECGGGLHFSPHPAMAMAFNISAKRFVACPVSIEDIVIHPNATMPQKVKARRCCGPVWECDIDGNRIGDK